MCNNGSRDWCFTAWREPQFDKDKIRYICWGLEECPTTYKEHWQGFVIFNGVCRLNRAKQLIGAGDDIHLERKRGTRVQAQQYCRKEGRFSEYGQFEQRTLEEILRLPINEIKDENLLVFLRYHRGLEKIQPKGPLFREVKIVILWGEPRCGKTREAMNCDSVFKLDWPYKWWDGYENEDRIIIDDYKEGTLDREYLLNICDGYRMRLETKGSHTWAKWSEVYITSNFNPEEWAPIALMARQPIVCNM